LFGSILHPKKSGKERLFSSGFPGSSFHWLTVDCIASDGGGAKQKSDHKTHPAIYQATHFFNP